MSPAVRYCGGCRAYKVGLHPAHGLTIEERPPTLFPELGAEPELEPAEVKPNPWTKTEAEAIAERDRGMAQVDENADAVWREHALEAVRVTATKLETFLVDDVWTVGELERTREDRALGPVMLRAARLKWIEKTDRTRPSVRSRMGPKPIWRSRIYGLGKGQV